MLTITLAGLAAGVTEAVAVVTPMEVIKIRLQAQHHSMADPLDVPKYRNAAHALYTVVKEEGVGALYRGISLTALRQGMFDLFPLRCIALATVGAFEAPETLPAPIAQILKVFCETGNETAKR